MKYLLISLCLILVAGCATNEDKPEPKHYSEDTNRAFEMIERGGSYYLKKAPTNTVPVPQVQAPQPKVVQEKRRVVETLKPGQERAVQEEIVIDEKINYQEKSPPSQPTPSYNNNSTSTPQVTRPRSSSKADERLIEINQNLAFYCMKHRKDPRFNDDEAKCMNFVNKAMTECQKSHRIVNSQLLNCIQARLKGKK